MADRQLRLGAFMRPVGIHTGWWRYPGAYPDANFHFQHLKRFAQTLERGRFDAFFMADHLAVLNMPIKALRRSATVTSLEPFTLLSALAGATEYIGLVATGSTTFDEPYHVARRFASLDHISGGRAGWNIVTTSNPDAALNFGRGDHLDHDERYRRAREFYDVVTGLWDSFAEDAFVRDVDSGIYFNPDRMHTLDHKGHFLKVRGPLNIARPIQGWPVIVQAGASDAGRQLAAETAEVIFAAGGSLDDGKRFYADVKSRMKKLGRSPEHLKVLPGAFVVTGDTVDEARKKKALLDSLVHPDSGLASLSIALGCDATNFDLDGPLPEIPESNASKSGRERFAKRDNLTVRNLPKSPAASADSRSSARRRPSPMNGAMALRGGLRRLQHHVSLRTRRPRGLRGQGCPRAAASRPVPTRIRGQDFARESGPAAARESGLKSPKHQSHAGLDAERSKMRRAKLDRS
jgi:alkanesulfonate monooxygenase